MNSTKSPMKKSDIKKMPAFYDQYINLVEDADIHALLDNSLDKLQNIDLSIYHPIQNYSYAPGKWTVKDVFQHVVDTERIMSYRALCLGRGELKHLPGFEENDYAIQAHASIRTLESIFEEWLLVRKSSILLFRSFTDEMFFNTGSVNGIEISTLALAFVILGHPEHHFRIIEERYRSS